VPKIPRDRHRNTTSGQYLWDDELGDRVEALQLEPEVGPRQQKDNGE
jgi:hypothetical protein